MANGEKARTMASVRTVWFAKGHRTAWAAVRCRSNGRLNPQGRQSRFGKNGLTAGRHYFAVGSTMSNGSRDSE